MRVDGPSGESRLGGSAREELSGADGLMAAGDAAARGLGHRLTQRGQRRGDKAEMSSEHRLYSCLVQGRQR